MSVQSQLSNWRCIWLEWPIILELELILREKYYKINLPSWLFSWASSQRPTTLMMALPANLAQIIIAAGALVPSSSASPATLAPPSYSVGGLITALYHQQMKQSLHSAVLEVTASHDSERLSRINVLNLLLHNTAPKRYAPGYTVYGSTVVNSSAAFSASLYIIAKTKKRGAR